MIEPNLKRFSQAIEESEPIKMSGKIVQVIGLVIESKGPNVSMGELCYIKSRFPGVEPIPAEVVGFRDGKVLLMPVGDMAGIGPGCEVVSAQKTLQVKVGPQLLGRVLDGLGNPMDGKGPILSKLEYPLQASPPDPLHRPRIHESLFVGVRAIDGLITLGSGQRIGIMAGSGVGKSTLLSMIARNTEADVSVISLVGERGREVRDFIERDLGEEGLKRAVVVVATSDRPALVRIKGAMTATAIAEYFRDQGKKVVLMMDSVTRFAMAQREVGLTIGEPPATRGYTPSVFALLPRLLERAGTSEKGSITGIYTVLVDGDDMNEPIADAVRSILDGHIVLSRAIAAQNHFPAIDVLASVSRVMSDVVVDEHMAANRNMRALMAVYKEAEDLIHIGAYVKGSSKKIDEAIEKIDAINGFLCQGVFEQTTFEQTIQQLEGI
ncbi:flagellar protein export ATPase FliI [Schwartzia succinivorans]|jgi:flagellum-specific ATP synthase|uniref:Type 3 secretion system ATPase n=1 Tax=Schwartzia succinivorans DSM 10502 TaxID=1123243 RepID=A0A1M4TD19_9FIRM|nr:flagellar protein export ATPase FliI [Schwartzia succinivorans]MBQ1469535.1 flagellar protein export ATPase FliI [Schwartzia sp. (in: firmicutes)]MBE6097079.1 flagellar protein export ATPase FliI [Schwartzia succinivorans]MBQ1918658.1 flagellar protein export ATPase FliI [Schwartzia sp. (in: firmicutes)]MBQ3863756.1 flagellar protein export ATPase FliI [Schwartzia sp. (in: firmicutes)]MBQ5413760.1 flagellar protein export ATPase FliI [Schwartzia sp. (in: firmicutes)]